MTNILDIVLLVIILVIIYYLFFNKKENEKYSEDKEQDEEEQEEQDQNLDLDQDLDFDVNTVIKSQKTHKINPYFQEMQFHNDYRDTMNAFEILLPTKKIVFNQENMPITDISRPESSEIKKLIVKFIKEVNKTVKHDVGNNFMVKNWNDNMPDKKEESGWDKEMRVLGLPGSIYNEPASKASIKLLKLDHAEKYQTDYEIRYVIYLIIKKKNVKDQMVVKVSFVIKTQDLNLDREFFDESKNDYKTPVLIEEISIIGYMVSHNFGKVSDREKFYNFDNITDGKMYDQKEIIKQLNDKRREYEKEQYN